jgi:hypothetical protein
MQRRRLIQRIEPRSLATLECHALTERMGTTRISENKIAASKPKRRIGCKVTSAASLGLKQRSRKVLALFADSPIFRQVSPGLPHQPDRRNVYPLRLQEREEEV